MKREQREAAADKMVEAMEVIGDLADLLKDTSVGRRKVPLGLMPLKPSGVKRATMHEALTALRDELDAISQEAT